MSVLPPPAVQSRWARRWLSPDSETRAAAPPVHRLPQVSSSVSDYGLRQSSMNSDMALRVQLAAAARSRSLLVNPHGVGRNCSPAEVPSEPPRASSKADHPVWAADRKLVSHGPPPTRSSQQRSHTSLTTPAPAPYRTTVSPSDPWIGYTTRTRDVGATTNAAMPQKWKPLETRSSFVQALPPPYPADRAARSTSSDVARASLHRRYISPAPPPPDFQAASSRSVSCLPPPSAPAVCTPDMAAAAHKRRTDARRGDAVRRSLTDLPHSPLWTPVRDSAAHSRQHRNTSASVRQPPAFNERIGRPELWSRRRLSGPLSVTIPRFEL